MQRKQGPAGAPGLTRGSGVIQLVKHTYQSRNSSSPIQDLTIDMDAAPNLMKLSSSNTKVRGKLTYRTEDDKTILKTVDSFPQGYGLGTVLLYHLGERAQENNSTSIPIGAPALTEFGFYLKMGASVVPDQALDQQKHQLLNDAGERDAAWAVISDDLARKGWDSGEYFLGKTNQRFETLQDHAQEALKKNVEFEVGSAKKQEMIDEYLTNRATYIVSAGHDGLVFRNIPTMMGKCQQSMAPKWKKVSGNDCIVS